MPGQIHARTEKAHAFTTQPRAMGAERGKPVRTDDPVTRDPRVVTRPHDVPDRARREWTTREHSDKAVGRDAARRDPLYDAANGARPPVRDQSPFPPTGRSSIESGIDAMSGRARLITSRTRSSFSDASCAARFDQTSVIHTLSRSVGSRLIT